MKLYTREEDEVIARMWAEGQAKNRPAILTYKAIGTELGRSWQTVRTRILSLEAAAVSGAKMYHHRKS